MWEEDDYRFYGQRPDEHVMLVRNQHITVLRIPILIDILILSILLLVYPHLPHPFNLYFSGIVIVSVFFSGFYYWYGYRNTVCVLTDQRIVNVTQKGFFNKKINEAELNRIQDVSTTVKGVMPTLFGYGQVTVSTASENTLVLHNMADPYELQQAILRVLRNGPEETTRKKPK